MFNSNVFKQSFLKSLKQTGMLVLTVVLASAAGVLVDSAAMEQAWRETPGGVLIIVPLLNLAGQWLRDYVKHSRKP